MPAHHKQAQVPGAPSISGRQYEGPRAQGGNMSSPTSAKGALSDVHREHLASSAINPDIIAERGYRTITGKVELLKPEGGYEY